MSFKPLSMRWTSGIRRRTQSVVISLSVRSGSDVSTYIHITDVPTHLPRFLNRMKPAVMTVAVTHRISANNNTRRCTLLWIPPAVRLISASLIGLKVLRKSEESTTETELRAMSARRKYVGAIHATRLHRRAILH